MKLLFVSSLFLLLSHSSFAYSQDISLAAKEVDLRGHIAVFSDDRQIDTLTCSYTDEQTQWSTFKTIANNIPGSVPFSKTYECVNQKNSKIIIMFFKWESCGCVVLYSNNVQGNKMLVNDIQSSEIALQVENNKYPLTFKKVSGHFAQP